MDKIKVWVSPEGDDFRKRYDQIENLSAGWKILHGDEEEVFLSLDKYPRKRGRKPKYRVLWVSVGGWDVRPTQELGERIYSYLKAIFPDRSILFFQYRHGKIIHDEKYGEITDFGEFFGYVVPWWSVKTGKVIPNKIGFFRDLRRGIIAVVEGKIVMPKPFWEWIPKREQREKTT